ncbi:MAG: Tol-Pal system beta propeller repeat protein TolB [Burkholderiaceae bacterium]|jgi:TolB protein
MPNPVVSRFLKTICLGLCTLALQAHAQLKIEIAGVGSTQIPIAIAPLSGDSDAAEKISAIIRDDLTRSGVFKTLDNSGPGLNENSSINHAEWRTRSVDALVVGSASRLADGRIDIRFRLHDVIKQQALAGQSFAVSPGAIRLTAHRIADIIYEKLIGEPGVFSTRFAYVSKAGGKYSLQISDADGQNPQTALVSREPIISPAWSPDGSRLAYVSFESKKPVIYVHSLATGQRTPVANYKGSNSAPAWSPNGGQLAVVLTRDGSSQIYLMGSDGSGLRRLTQSNGIDTEPVFSADGLSIYFTSDRGGGPQIYKMNPDGSNVRRVTFKGNYNISPRPSPDGKLLTYITRREGRFQVAVTDLSTGEETILTDTSRDESPSFAPNNRLILYATQTSGRGVLAVVSPDGRIKQKISVSGGEVREPTWGPFLKF